MPPTKLHQLAELGQSIWLDYISRELIRKGKLKEWVDQGLRGMTSNPSIFNQVISQGSDYDESIASLKELGKSTFEIYDELTVSDIKDAADAFRPIYESTNHLDGYVSLEINPQLAHHEAASIQEGLRLFEKVSRPNLMIKVPATKEGFPVIEELLAQGVNVNVTLIFSLEQYESTVDAFFKGLYRHLDVSGSLAGLRSVASVFVSRIDTLVDKKIAELKKADLNDITGKSAVANSKLIYERFQQLFNSETFSALKQKGAHIQRVLWGSTSAKNPAYRDVKYVEELIAPDTVNTVPENTLCAFMDHGEIQPALKGSLKDAQEVFNKLTRHGIHRKAVCDQLLKEGVSAFDQAFAALLKTIETKAIKIVTGTN